MIFLLNCTASTSNRQIVFCAIESAHILSCTVTKLRDEMNNSTTQTHTHSHLYSQRTILAFASFVRSIDVSRFVCRRRYKWLCFHQPNQALLTHSHANTYIQSRPQTSEFCFVKKISIKSSMPSKGSTIIIICSPSYTRHRNKFSMSSDSLLSFSLNAFQVLRCIGISRRSVRQVADFENNYVDFLVAYEWID